MQTLTKFSHASKKKGPKFDHLVAVWSRVVIFTVLVLVVNGPLMFLHVFKLLTYHASVSQQRASDSLVEVPLWVGDP